MNNCEKFGERVELWLRSYGPAGTAGDQTAVVERLRALERRGLIGDVALRTWPRRLRRLTPAADGKEGRAVLDRVASFREWASEHGRSLSPAFGDARGDTDGRRLTRDDEEVLVLPAMALAEFDGDDLVYVTPHREGDRIRTVEDRIAALSVEDRPLEATVESE